MGEPSEPPASTCESPSHLFSSDCGWVRDKRPALVKRDPRNSQRSHTGQSLLCCLHSTITQNYSNNHSLVEGEDSVALICEPEIQDITYPVVNQWSEPLRG